jgi:hypothetical protein
MITHRTLTKHEEESKGDNERISKIKRELQNSIHIGAMIVVEEGIRKDKQA